MEEQESSERPPEVEGRLDSYEERVAEDDMVGASLGCRW